MNLLKNIKSVNSFLFLKKCYTRAMKEFLKQNIVIVLAFSFPFVLIIGAVISIYTPSLFVKTNYNFIYTFCTNQSYYSCDTTLPKKYTVENGKLMIHEQGSLGSTTSAIDTYRNSIPGVQEYPARLFLHDTKTNTSREITKEEAVSLTLDGLLTSPDGASISGRSDRNGGDFLFFGGESTYNYYLMKAGHGAKLSLIQNDGSYYKNNFEFIGWVVPGGN